MSKNRRRVIAVLALALAQVSLLAASALAHHVLGRPSYGLGDESNTPPAMQVEARVGEYLVTVMAFPAFPAAGETGRINLYAVHAATDTVFDGEVRFTARRDSWFPAEEIHLGIQRPDDGVYRQRFVFADDGDYLITAQIGTGNAAHHLDFPLRIGEPSPVLSAALAGGAAIVAVLFFVLIRGGRAHKARLRRREVSR